MTNRRAFLQQSGAALLGALLLPGQRAFSGVLASQPIGVQLYTLFAAMDADTKGSLQHIKKIGYNEIESAFSRKGGFYGMKPKEFATMVNDTGLTWRSHHVLGSPIKSAKLKDLPPMVTLQDNIQKLVDDSAEGGVQYMVCASIPIATPKEVSRSVELLNKTGEAAKKAGLTFCYHNHDREFVKQGDKTIYDTFLAGTDAELVKMEMDLAWVTKAGYDPVELFKQHPGRFPCWHVKDIDASFQTLLPVGDGVVDFKMIFANRKTAGMQHFFVEHDQAVTPFESISSSYKHLRKLLR